MREKLMERRQALLDGIQEMLATAEAAGRDLTEDERAKRDKNLTDVKAMTADLKAMDEAEELRSLVTPTPARRAVGASHGPSVAENQKLMISPEYRSAFEGWMKSGDDREMRLLGATTGSSGGFLVPTVIYDEIFDATLKLSPVLAQVKHINSTDDKLALPIKTTAGGFAYVTEGNKPNANDPALSQLILGSLKGQWNITVDENLRNSTVDVASWMSGLFAEGLAEFLEAEIITGVDTTALAGILVGGTVALTTASATAITRAEIEKCYFAMPSKYLGTAMWVLSGTVAEKIAAIANSVTGDFLWAPSLADGYAWKILGRPALVTDGAPAWAANKNLIAFFNPGSYLLKDGGLEIKVSEHAAFESCGLVYRAVWVGDGGLAAATHAQIIKSKA